MSVSMIPYMVNRTLFGKVSHSSIELETKSPQMKTSKMSLRASILLVWLRNPAMLISNEKPLMNSKWDTRNAPVPTIKQISVLSIKKTSPSKLNKNPMRNSFLGVEKTLEERVSMIRGTGLASCRAKI